MQHPKITFIGGGNMCASLLGGLITDGWPSSHLHAVEPDTTRRDALQTRFNIQVSPEADNAAQQAAVVVLAVKPQVMQSVCVTLAESVQQHKPLIISIAAGIHLDDIERWLGGNLAIVRSMPNTPALLQSGATALYANTRVDNDQKQTAETILRAVGLTLWLDDEHMLDAVTALSGSGPAYFFLMMEAMQDAAIKLGLDPQQARLLTLQTAFGAAKMALESDQDAAELRHRVTSPGGTTESAISVFESGNYQQLVEQAMTAARDRATELANILGRDA
ncbi:MAG TPA: pyrroline-5-carboxylate reductase [Gammaproteobacteria bacterium]|mgnify:CR=1 FL=1|nr:pyrroline-5-carboxylate reductase [Gammaproteobacteria bacterium]